VRLFSALWSDHVTRTHWLHMKRMRKVRACPRPTDTCGSGSGRTYSTGTAMAGSGHCAWLGVHLVSTVAMASYVLLP